MPEEPPEEPPAPLSPAWIVALDAAVRDVDLGAGAEGVVLQQVVPDAPGGEVAYVLAVAGGRATVRAGRDPAATVTLTAPHTAAVAIATGAMGAQAAFMRGQLRIGGDPQELLRAGPVLAALAPAIAALHAAP